MGTCFSVLIRTELARPDDQIIPLWMYLYGADDGPEALQETCHLATAETVGKGLKSRWYRS